jgi:hypothetical protein
MEVSMRAGSFVLCALLALVACDESSPPRPADARREAAGDRSGVDRSPVVADLSAADRPGQKDVTAWPTCSDGTVVGQCSAQNKPFFCNAQQKLEHRCSACGCPGLQKCNTALQSCEDAVAKLLPKADAYVDELQPAKNYGSEPELKLARQWGTKGWMDSYLDFDLPAELVQAGILATIEKATLKLQVVGWGGWPVDYEVGLISGSWSELQITYSSVPAVQSSPISGRMKWGSNEIDVSSLVQAWVLSSAAVHGLRLKALPPSVPIPPPTDAGAGYGYSVTMDSREHADPTKRPILEIVYR